MKQLPNTGCEGKNCHPAAPCWTLENNIFIRQHVIISAFPCLMLSWSSTTPSRSPLTIHSGELLLPREAILPRGKNQMGSCERPPEITLTLGRLHTAGMRVPALPVGHRQAGCPQPSRSSQHQVDLALKLPVGLLDGKTVQKHPPSWEALLERLACALLKRRDQSALSASHPEQQRPTATAQGAQPSLEREAWCGGMDVSHRTLKAKPPEPRPVVLCCVMDEIPSQRQDQSLRVWIIRSHSCCLQGEHFTLYKE